MLVYCQVIEEVVGSIEGEGSKVNCTTKMCCVMNKITCSTEIKEGIYFCINCTTLTACTTSVVCCITDKIVSSIEGKYNVTW